MQPTIFSSFEILFGELAVKILVAADPYPYPNVAHASLRNRAVIPGHANRPKAWVLTQSFELQRGMRGLGNKFFMSRVNVGAGGLPDALRAVIRLRQG